MTSTPRGDRRAERTTTQALDWVWNFVSRRSFCKHHSRNFQGFYFWELKDSGQIQQRNTQLALDEYPFSFTFVDGSVVVVRCLNNLTTASAVLLLDGDYLERWLFSGWKHTEGEHYVAKAVRGDNEARTWVASLATPTDECECSGFDQCYSFFALGANKLDHLFGTDEEDFKSLTKFPGPVVLPFKDNSALVVHNFAEQKHATATALLSVKDLKQWLLRKTGWKGDTSDQVGLD